MHLSFSAHQRFQCTSKGSHLFRVSGTTLKHYSSRHCQLFGCCLVAGASVFSMCYVRAMTHYKLGGRRMSLSRWDEGSDSDHVRGVNWDIWLAGHRKILAWQWAKLPRYGREGAVEVRPFPAEKRLRVSEAQGLSDEAMKGNQPTRVIAGVDESKSSPRNNRRLDRTLVSTPPNPDP